MPTGPWTSSCSSSPGWLDRQRFQEPAARAASTSKYRRFLTWPDFPIPLRGSCPIQLGSILNVVSTRTFRRGRFLTCCKRVFVGKTGNAWFSGGPGGWSSPPPRTVTAEMTRRRGHIRVQESRAAHGVTRGALLLLRRDDSDARTETTGPNRSLAHHVVHGGGQ